MSKKPETGFIKKKEKRGGRVWGEPERQFNFIAALKGGRSRISLSVLSNKKKRGFTERKVKEKD